MGIDRTEISRIENGRRKPSRSIIYKYSQFFEVDLDYLNQEQMSVHSIRLSKKMVEELMIAYEHYGNDLSTIIRCVLQEALDTHCFERQQDLLIRLIYNALSQRSKDEIQEMKKLEVNMEFVKIAIMECFAQLLHATESDKEELTAMLMRNAKNVVYKQ